MSEATENVSKKKSNKKTTKGKSSKKLRHHWEFTTDKKDGTYYRCVRDGAEKRVLHSGGARGGSKVEYRAKGGTWSENCPPVKLPN